MEIQKEKVCSRKSFSSKRNRLLEVQKKEARSQQKITSERNPLMEAQEKEALPFKEMSFHHLRLETRHRFSAQVLLRPGVCERVASRDSMDYIIKLH